LRQPRRSPLLVGSRAQKARHLRFQNLLHRPLHQLAKKVLAAETALQPLHDHNTLSLASHLHRLLLNVVFANNILRNRHDGSRNLSHQQLLQNSTDSIISRL
jgi:hypothetical protein